MQRPTFWKRRPVWTPTLWGWTLLAAFAAGGSLLGLGGLYPFLALERPVGARLLVVEGWIGDEGLARAAELCATGQYERVVASGGPITSWAKRLGFANYAELAADSLVRLGVPAQRVIAVPAPASAQERTFLSAVMVREWAARQSLAIDGLDVLSAGVHARRTRLLYRLAFGPGVRVGILAVQPGDFDPARWWRSSAGAKAVVGEALSLLWTELCFWPGERGSPEELWAASGGAAAAQ